MLIKDNKIYEISYHIIEYKDIKARHAASHILFNYNFNDLKQIIFRCKDCYVYVIFECELINIELYQKYINLNNLLDKELYILYKYYDSSYKLINITELDIKYFDTLT